MVVDTNNNNKSQQELVPSTLNASKPGGKYRTPIPESLPTSDPRIRSFVIFYIASSYCELHL